MAHSPSAYTQDTVANTDDDNLTQASLSPGPSRQSQHCAGDDEHDGTTDLDKKIDDVEDTTGHNPLQPATRLDIIHIHSSNNTVSWGDKDGDHQSTDPLDLEIVIDTSANTALLRLCGEVYINCRNPFNRRAIYLYIRPENIVSITYRNDNNTRSLSFSLQRKPDLITPKEPINARSRSQALLDAIMAISTVTEFTVRLDSSSTAPAHLLKKVASIFSPRPTWNDELGNLSRLYEGEGGLVANANMATSPIASTDLEDGARTEFEAHPDRPSGHGLCRGAIQATILEGGGPEAPSPPPYRSASKKRKRDSPDIESDSSSTKSDMPSINVMLRKMEQRIMNSIQQLGQKLDDVDSCRYGTEEREDVMAEVTQRCDDEFIDLKVESADVFEEVKGDVERVLNQVDDDVKERIDVLEDELDERLRSYAKEAAEAAAEKYVKETLLNASWRMDGTMSLQRQP
ncbi:hypothetical protein V8C44DRAFT_354949 [Trichoderma aethiopicum]